MKFLEKDLEEIIAASDNEDLRRKGLPIFGRKLRQLRIGNYGISDIITIESPLFIPKCQYLNRGFHEDPLTITVYELKKDEISVSTLLQSMHYAKGIQRYLNHKRPDNEYEINICLIGKGINVNGGFPFMADLFERLSFYTYSYSIDGIKFNMESGYSLTDEGFKLKEK